MNRMQTNALVNGTLTAAAAPAVTIIKPFGKEQTVASGQNGFRFELELALPYAALSPVLDVLLQGKRLQVTEGLIDQHVVLDGCTLYGDAQHRLVAEVPFSGSYSGTAVVFGTPVYQSQLRRIELQNVAYDIKTNNLLLRGAKWLFGNLILNEIRKHASFDLTPLCTAAAARLTESLNKAWGKGLQAQGAVTDLNIIGIEAEEQQLRVQAQCTGRLELTVTEADLKL